MSLTKQTTLEAIGRPSGSCGFMGPSHFLAVYFGTVCLRFGGVSCASTDKRMIGI